MDRHGFLGRLVFQGGTCLRLCYDAVRYSEDLDFAGGPDFQADDLAGLGKILEGGIAAVSTRPSYANSWSTNSTTTTSGTRSPQGSIDTARYPEPRIVRVGAMTLTRPLRSGLSRRVTTRSRAASANTSGSWRTDVRLNSGC